MGVNRTSRLGRALEVGEEIVMPRDPGGFLEEVLGGPEGFSCLLWVGLRSRLSHRGVGLEEKRRKEGLPR